MRSFEAIVLLSLAVTGLGEATYVTHPDSDCGVDPIDIQFLLDMSKSAGPNNFNVILDFVHTFADSFDIGPNKVQIGVWTFDHLHKSEFAMNAHQNKADLLQAILDIPYREDIKGSSKIFPAIESVVQNAFSKGSGNRDGVKDVLIVITDSKIEDEEFARWLAEMYHSKSIKVIVVGIGDDVSPDQAKLLAFDSRNVFHVDSFAALSSIQNQVETKTCEGDDFLTNSGDAVELVTHPTAQCNVSPIDIQFLLDMSKSAGPNNFKIMLDFVHTLASSFEIGPDKVQIGVSTFRLYPRAQFWMNKHQTKAELLQAILDIPYLEDIEGPSYLAPAMFHAGGIAFSKNFGNRDGVTDVLIAITDSQIIGNEIVWKPVVEQYNNNSIKIVAIGIGDKISVDQMKLFETDLSTMFHVDSFAALGSIQNQVETKTCEVCPFWNDTDAVRIDGKCLRLFKSPLKWMDAKAACEGEGHGVTMLVPHSEGVRKFVKAKAKELKQRLWLGASDQTQEGTWVRVSDGKPANIDKSWWARGQPDNFGGNEDCLLMRTDGRLNDSGCGTKRPYLCESVQMM